VFLEHTTTVAVVNVTVLRQKMLSEKCMLPTYHNKKLRYRRGTARCIVSVEICQLPRNSAETTCTTSPEQVKVMKLKLYSKAMCNKHVHSTVTRSSRFFVVP